MIFKEKYQALRIRCIMSILAKLNKITLYDAFTSLTDCLKDKADITIFYRLEIFPKNF